MFLIITNQILKMFLILIVGYICYHTKLVDHHGNKVLSNLLLLVVNPILIVNALQMDYSASRMKGFLLAALLAALTHVVGILLSRVLFPEKRSRDYNIEQFSSIYSNCGFMGIPLANSILGSEGILFITSYMIVFNLFCWTHGLMLMTGNASRKQIKKGLTSPVMIASVIGLFLFVLQIRLPSVVNETIGYISNMNTPMAMLIAGVALAETNLFGALKNRRLYLVTAVKLLILPLVMLVCLSFLPFDHKVLCAVLLAAACPCATTGTMFALRYDGNYKYASELFAFTTVVSMATIPVIIYLAERVLPI